MNPLDLLPPQLTESATWLLWRQETKPGETKPRKVPYVAQLGPRRRASSTDPTTWRTYEEARAVYEADPSQWAGLGFVFAQGAGFCGIDLDGCRDPQTDELAPWAREVVERSATYTEVSPSGTGVKLFVHGTVPAGRNVKLGPVVEGRAPGIEVYGEGRFFTVTGQRLPDTPNIVAEGQADLDWLWQKYFAKPEPTAAPRPAVQPSADRAAVVERAARYVGTIPGAVEGSNGSGTTFKVAQHLAVGFGLTEKEAAPILHAYNATCVPPWNEADLLRKFREAREKSRCPAGYLLRENAPRAWKAEHEDGRTWANGGGNHATKPRAPRGKPKLLCMADVEPVEVVWLWPGRIALGRVTLLIGYPGVGKSFLTMFLAARVSRGKGWPDATNGVAGEVVLVTAEDDPADTIAPRLLAHGADMKRINVLTGVQYASEGEETLERGFTLEDIGPLEQALDEHPDTKLIIIDPINSYLGGQADAHRDNEVRSVLAPLAALAAKYGAAVVMVTHRRKASSGFADDLALGSRAFTGLARAVWHLCEDDEDPDRKLLLAGKNNLAPKGTGLAFRIEGDAPAIVWEEGSVDRSADDHVQREQAGERRAGRPSAELDTASAYLSEKLAAGRCPTHEVEEEGREKHGLSKRTLDRARQKLGVVAERGDDGKWMLTLPGASLIAALEDQPCQNPDPQDAKTPNSNNSGILALWGKHGENEAIQGSEALGCQNAKMLGDETPDERDAGP